MISDIVSALGSYTPIVGADGSVSPDYGYIFAALLVCIAVYSVFRLLGSFFGGRR